MGMHSEECTIRSSPLGEHPACTYHKRRWHKKITLMPLKCLSKTYIELLLYHDIPFHKGTLKLSKYSLENIETSKQSHLFSLSQVTMYLLCTEVSAGLFSLWQGWNPEPCTLVERSILSLSFTSPLLTAQQSVFTT